MNIKFIIDLIVGALNFAPGLKTKVGAIAAVLSALIVAVSVVLTQFNMGFEIPYLNEINAILLALIGVGSANQPNNLPKPNA